MGRVGSVAAVAGGIVAVGVANYAAYQSFWAVVWLLHMPAAPNVFAVRFQRRELGMLLLLSVVCVAVALLGHLKTGKVWRWWNTVLFAMPFYALSTISFKVFVPNDQNDERWRGLSFDAIAQPVSLGQLLASFPCILYFGVVVAAWCGKRLAMAKRVTAELREEGGFPKIGWCEGIAALFVGGESAGGDFLAVWQREAKRRARFNRKKAAREFSRTVWRGLPDLALHTLRTGLLRDGWGWLVPSR